MKKWHRAKENKMWLRVIIAPTWEHLESTLVDSEHTFAMAIQEVHNSTLMMNQLRGLLLCKLI